MSLELVVGCMFSGKSSELMRRVNRTQSIQKSYVIYNSILDTRYGSRGIFTHNQGHVPCHIIDSLTEQLGTTEFLQADYIFLDESQFFNDLVYFCKQAVEVHKKHVVVVGLDGDSERRNFGHIHELLPLCDTITKLKALCSVCKDGTLGLFSKKIIQSTKQVDIGSTDKYSAVCRECYLK